MAREQLTTPDGDPIVAWGTYGSVRGYGPLRVRQEDAMIDLYVDQDGCREQRGYSDRNLVAVDSAGCCWSLDYDSEIGEHVSNWIAGPGGRSCGAARYSTDEIAAAVKAGA